MRWPWQPEQAGGERLAFSLHPDRLHWAVLDQRSSPPSLARFGMLPLPVGDDEARARAVRALGLPATQAMAVLPLADYQMLQIEAPAVPPDELKAAARWRIKDMVSGHVDDVTLDVMQAGSPQGLNHRQLFVVAASNAAIKATSQLAQASGLRLAVIDIVDTAQRNLHTRAAAAQDLSDRATACLMVHGAHGLLTICIGDELFYSRRLEWDPTLAQVAAQSGETVSAPSVQAEPALAETGMQWAGDAMAYELGAPDEIADVTPRPVIELQRSFDVWERSWPDQPVAQLLLHTGHGSPAVATYLQGLLGLRVQALDLAQALPGAEQGGDWGGEHQACLPLLGALLRTNTPQR
jgi:MSHA biogenesis protein MshI